MNIIEIDWNKRRPRIQKKVPLRYLFESNDLWRYPWESPAVINWLLDNDENFSLSDVYVRVVLKFLDSNAMLSRFCCRSWNSGFYIGRAATCAPVRTLNDSTASRSDTGKPSSKSLIDQNLGLISRRFVRWNSTIPQDFAMAKSQLLDSLKGIKLRDAKDAPGPIFWSGVAGLVPIVVPPLTFVLFGYTHTLATIQMTFSATISAFLSGTKYGTHVASPTTADWPHVVASIVPQFVAFTGLILPDVIGFPLITVAIAANGFIDLTSGNYPAWYKALRVGLTVPVLASCFITCIFKLFNVV